MNILTIPATYGLLKPPSGAQNRLYNLVEQLKKRRDEVIVLEAEDLADLNEKNLVKAYYFKDIVLASRRLNIFRDININFVLNLVKILKSEQIDIIEFSFPSGIIVTKLIIKLMKERIPIIYNSHNVESNSVKVSITHSKYSVLEKLLVPIYVTFLERFTSRYIVDCVIAVSETDKEIFIKKYNLNQERVNVVPSGGNIIDISTSDSCKDKLRREMGIGLESTIIFFHGSYLPPGNSEAIEVIKRYLAPQFEEDRGVIFLVGGFEVPKFECSNVKSVGFIEDLSKVLSIVNIAIVPLLRGAGTKLKVFDYMAARLPIVITRTGIEGINANNGEHALITDDVDDLFVAAIKYLIDNPQERERIGINGRKLIEEEYNWDKIGGALHDLYKNISMKVND